MILIDVLPDEVLLAIFDFCVDKYQHTDKLQYTKKKVEAWQSLVHVCRRWRNIVFGSPRRLDLQLFCGPTTPARDLLDVWPVLPLLIRCDGGYSTERVDDIIAVLGRSNRLRQIIFMNFRGPRSYLEKVLEAMQVPFPELTDLRLSMRKTAKTDGPVIPDQFLGGSVPRLHTLWLNRIPFPALPKLLLSATHLVELFLSGIPHSGYFSPEAIVAALSKLTSLKSLSLEFQSPQSCPDRASRRLPPPTCTVLPALTVFWFKGVTEYLDDLVARVDAPRLNNLYITFFNQIDFDTPQLIQFISRTPTLNAPKQARVVFGDGAANINLSSTTSPHVQGELHVKIPCRELDWQVSSLEQICSSSFPPLSTLEFLLIHEASSRHSVWQGNIENTLWLELLRPFAAVKDLHLSKRVAAHIVPALQELVGGRTTEVLPIVQNIDLEWIQPSGPVQEGISKFVAARQFSSHPIMVSLSDGNKTRSRRGSAP